MARGISRKQELQFERRWVAKNRHELRGYIAGLEDALRICNDCALTIDAADVIKERIEALREKYDE